MTVVLVHGNPETATVWQPLVEALGRSDVTCLSPPGFGAPVPLGWGGTVEQYRDWLIGELEAFGRPVDLVGHDWGGAHVVNVAMRRPDLLHSWCSDVIALYDPEYVWHDLAQVWQTPGAGEQAVAEMGAATIEQRAEQLAAAGVPPESADRLAEGFDETMGECILALYRSAAQPVMAQIGRRLPAAAQRPGLAVIATDDHYAGSDRMRRRSAARAGARVEVLAGLGHWWMLQAPVRGAEMLSRFWASLGD